MTGRFLKFCSSLLLTAMTCLKTSPILGQETQRIAATELRNIFDLAQKPPSGMLIYGSPISDPAGSLVRPNFRERFTLIHLSEPQDTRRVMTYSFPMGMRSTNVLQGQWSDLYLACLEAVRFMNDLGRKQKGFYFFLFGPDGKYALIHGSVLDYSVYISPETFVFTKTFSEALASATSVLLNLSDRADLALLGLEKASLSGLFVIEPYLLLHWNKDVMELEGRLKWLMTYGHPWIGVDEERLSRGIAEKLSQRQLFNPKDWKDLYKLMRNLLEKLTQELQKFRLGIDLETFEWMEIASEIREMMRLNPSVWFDVLGNTVGREPSNEEKSFLELVQFLRIVEGMRNLIGSHQMTEFLRIYKDHPQFEFTEEILISPSDRPLWEAIQRGRIQKSEVRAYLPFRPVL